MANKLGVNLLKLKQSKKILYLTELKIMFLKNVTNLMYLDSIFSFILIFLFKSNSLIMEYETNNPLIMMKVSV